MRTVGGSGDAHYWDACVFDFITYYVVCMYTKVLSLAQERILYVWSGSTIGESGDTTISSPGRSPKQPLPGIDYMIHYIVGKLAPNSSHLTRQGVGQICSR